MSSEENKEVVRGIEAAWDQNRLDDLDQYFAPGFAPGSGVAGLPRGLESAKMAHQMSMQTFPDRKVEIVDMIAEDDKVFVRTRLTGTNMGGAFWFGAPEPSDKKVDFESWSVYLLEDGKVVDHWGLNDALTAMVQLGGYTPPMPPS